MRCGQSDAKWVLAGRIPHFLPQISLAAIGKVQANKAFGRSKLCKHIARLEKLGKFLRSKAELNVFLLQCTNV